MPTVKATIGQTPYATRLETPDHTWTVDEPADVGGGNAGPRPGDLLAASLAACTAITLRMYVNRKGWPVDDISVEATVERDVEANQTTFRCRVSATGDLTDEQRARLLHIANACPVHKMLINPIRVETELLTEPIVSASATK
jgi:putative redox protein